MRRIRYTEQEGNEEILELIKEVIESSWSEEKSQILQLLKGIVYSDTDVAEKFIQDLDNLTSSMNLEDYE